MASVSPVPPEITAAQATPINTRATAVPYAVIRERRVKARYPAAYGS